MHQLASSKHQTQSRLINTEISNKNPVFISSDRFIRITIVILIIFAFFTIKTLFPKGVYRDREKYRTTGSEDEKKSFLLLGSVHMGSV